MVEHNCRQEDNIGKLFDRLNEIKQECALTNQLLKGNGVKGLCDRVEDLEKTVGNLNILKAQFLAIGAFIGFLTSLAISILK